MTQFFDFSDLGARDRYKLLTAVVLPRPVAWITTQSPAGLVNAAPYSFFNVFGADPSLVVLGLENHAGGVPKDTTRNIAETGEFVVNIATPDLNAEMVATAAAYAPDTSEPEALGLALAPSVKVAPPRLAKVPVALECRKLTGLSFNQERELLVGDVVGLATRDGLVDADSLHVDWQGKYPVARLFADRYARLEEIDRQAIPQPKVP